MTTITETRTSTVFGVTRTYDFTYWVKGTSTDKCDFCSKAVEFSNFTDGVFSWLGAVDTASGSDHLATWCGECGAKHRK